MKVLFVDIDGVLNNLHFLIKKGRFSEIDGKKLFLLKEIVDKTGAEIVLTSSWRNDPSLDLLFADVGLTIYDRTKDKKGQRGEEIDDWLSSHEVENYVILDDECSDYTEEQMKHAIITKECFSQDLRAEVDYYEGLQEKHVLFAVSLLNDDDDVPSDVWDTVYCPVCGHCGEVGCCGVEVFFDKHVRGKTNCLYEEAILEEILEMLEDYKRMCKEEVENERSRSGQD